MIGIFSGNSKPSAAKDFLQEFVTEVITLEKGGFVYKSRSFEFCVSAFVCDAPARSFTKNVKAHSGYSSCEKCTQTGVWEGRVTFPDIDAVRRTDDTFRLMEDDEHHKGPSPLEGTSIGMVSQFPLDYMHLVCLGVMRRLLNLWMKGPLRTRIQSKVVNEISTTLEGLKSCIPIEFARKPRSLEEVNRWKATEFRQFLIYTGPIALIGKLSDVLYDNFMLLSVAIFILLNPSLCSLPAYVDYAEKLLILFVEHYTEVYGKEMVVYNVHGLIHLGCSSRNWC